MTTERGVSERSLEVPAADAPFRALFVTADDADFVYSGDLTRVEVVTAIGRRPAGAPRLIGRAPALEIIDPAEGAVVRLDSGFVARFGAVPAGTQIVIEAVAGDADAVGSLSGSIPSQAAVRRDDGSMLMDVFATVPEAASGALPWRKLAALIRERLVPLGVTSVPVRLRFLARIGPSPTIALSPWRRILVGP